MPRDLELRVMKTSHIRHPLPFARNQVIQAGVVLALSIANAACDDDVVTAPPENRAPTAVVVADLTEVPAGDANSTIVTISGAASFDPDGNALTFNWLVSGATFEAGSTASSSTIKVSFPGTAFTLVTLVIDDGNGGTDVAQITIGITAPKNRPPVASLSVSPTTVPAGDGNVTVITLNAADTLDPDGDLLTFNWTVPGGTFVGGTGPGSEVAQITLPGDGQVLVTLEVTDEGGLTDSKSFLIRLT